MSLQKDPHRREMRFLRSFGGFAGKRVLELGAGEGRLTWEYAAETASVVALDIDRDALRVARIDAPAAIGERALLVQAGAEALPFRNDSFDLAVFAWSF